MSQLRDDIKYPVKELSRALSNPPELDIANLEHLLKYVNNTRDRICIMKPVSGLTPVRIVGYLDSDCAECQRSRSQCLFNEQNSSKRISFISRSRSLHYASSYSRVIDNQAFRSGVQFKAAVAEVSIIVKTDSSMGKTMASRSGTSHKSKHTQLQKLWMQGIPRGLRTSSVKELFLWRNWALIPTQHWAINTGPSTRAFKMQFWVRIFQSTTCFGERSLSSLSAFICKSNQREDLCSAQLMSATASHVDNLVFWGLCS